MKNRTLEDLERLKAIREKRSDLKKEEIKILSECPCLDFNVEGIETLSFDVSPKPICPVCEKITKHELTTQQKIDCIEQNLSYRYKNIFTEKDYKKMAEDGGFIYPSFNKD